MKYAGGDASYSDSGSSEALKRFCFPEKAAPGRWKYPPVSIDIVNLHGPSRQVLPPVRLK
tara:strand:- start:496 stop:675 length:180 start_codon:yes stop_codon:yes gene_type:complete